MRFLFRPRPVNSLQQALQLVHAAMAIAWAHRHNASYSKLTKYWRILTLPSARSERLSAALT